MPSDYLRAFVLYGADFTTGASLQNMKHTHASINLSMRLFSKMLIGTHGRQGRQHCIGLDTGHSNVELH